MGKRKWEGKKKGQRGEIGGRGERKRENVRGERNREKEGMGKGNWEKR